jgi:tRNA-dihydrouridine synthase 3
VLHHSVECQKWIASHYTDEKKTSLTLAAAVWFRCSFLLSRFGYDRPHLMSPHLTEILPRLHAWGCAAATLHGRTKEQRYTKEADWSYIETIAERSSSVPLIGNGDIYSYQDAIRHMRSMRLDDDDGDDGHDDAGGDGGGGGSGVTALMLARGALIKPWLFTEIKERRHWDISSSERFDMLRDFTNFGLEQWGSDDQGVLNVRKFLM